VNTPSARPPKPPKKLATMVPWRTTFGMESAVYKTAHARGCSYGELMRRAVAFYLAGDERHDFESQPLIFGANVFPESTFDPDSRV
jgi:hypothetical protein